MTVRTIDSRWENAVDFLTAGRLPRCPDFMRHFSKYSPRQLRRWMDRIREEPMPMETWRDTFRLGKEWRALGYNWFGGSATNRCFGGGGKCIHHRRERIKWWRYERMERRLFIAQYGEDPWK